MLMTFTTVFTAYHNHGVWQEQLGIRFVHFPFAVDADLFKHYHEPKQYDLGFSGSLYTAWTDIRARIRKRLFRPGFIQRPHYRGWRVYWGEWETSGTRTGKGYARLINSSWIWLSTTSAIDLAGARFYETMASHSLLFCNHSPVYEGLFEEGTHCVMFENDLSDFDDKLFWYLKHHDEREAIVKRGYQHVCENHTWDKRVEQFTKTVEEIL